MSFNVIENTKRLAELSRLEISDLQDKKVGELNEIGKGLISGFSRLSKAEKIAAISDLVGELKNSEIDLSNQAEVEVVPFNELQGVSFDELKTFAIDLNGNFTKDANNIVNKAISTYLTIKSEIESLDARGEIDKLLDFVDNIYLDFIDHERALQSNRRWVETTLADRRKEYKNFLNVCFEKDSYPFHKELRKTAIKRLCDKLYSNKTYKQITVKRNESSEAKIFEKNANRKEIKVVELYNYHLNVVKNAENKDWRDVVKAIVFSTGRRPSEILCSARFCKVDTHWLEFKGRSKCRRHSFDPDFSMIIPTVFPADLVLSAMEALEGMQDDKFRPIRIPYKFETYDDHLLSLKKTDDLRSVQMSRSFGNSFSGMELTGKDYRAIYTKTTYSVFLKSTETNKYLGLGPKASLTVWAQKTLGHEKSDTQISYDSYVIDNSESDTFKELVLGK